MPLAEKRSHDLFTVPNDLIFLSAFISIPPLLGWKKDPDLSWFEELKEYQQV